MYVPHEGLGIWGAILPAAIGVGTRIVKGSDAPKIPSEVYYPDTLLGIVQCPGPFDVGAVANAIERIPRLRDPGYTVEAARLRNSIVSLLGRDTGYRRDQWGMPDTPIGQAGALVGFAHGGRDCTPNATEVEARELIGRILEYDAALQARLAQERTVAASMAPGLPGTLGGTRSGPLLLGAAALLGLFLAGRAT